MRKAVVLLLTGLLALAAAVACGPEDTPATSPPAATQPPPATQPLSPTSPPAATPETIPTPTQAPQPTSPPSTSLPPEPTATPGPSVGADVGDLAPGFTLPSASGTDVSLDSFRGEKNVVLVYYRGSF